MSTTLVKVPEGANALDVLAARYRAAFDRLKQGRAEWIEGTLELAVVVAKLRGQYPAHQEFSRWLERMKLQKLDKNQRTAMFWMAENLEAARKLLQRTDSWSWELIYRNERQNPLPSVRKGAQKPMSRSSGAHWRNQAQRIPDVMQRDNPPSTPPPPKRLSDYGLTPEQVDPDFKGTRVEFAAKYGPVNLHTKDQIERHKQQEALSTWIGTVLALEKASRTMLGALSGVDPATITEWKGKNGKADKLRAWYESIQTAADALTSLARL